MKLENIWDTIFSKPSLSAMNKKIAHLEKEIFRTAYKAKGSNSLKKSK